MSKAPRKKKARRWVTAALGSAPDPRVDAKDPEYGKRRVDRLVIIDSEGAAWDFVGRVPARKLPPPPDET